MRQIPKVMMILALVLAAGLAVTETAEACSCFPPTVASAYNNATDVWKVSVKSTTTIGDNTYYLVEVRKTYKGCVEPRANVTLVTRESGAQCGVDLTNGVEYLINSTELSAGLGLYEIGLCGYNVEFASLTDDEINFLNTRFNCCGEVCNCAMSPIAACQYDPCTLVSCAEAKCNANFCGGCNAEFFDDFGRVVCNSCVTNGDCELFQVCSAAGQCRTQCFSDDECAAGQTCGADSTCN